MKISRIGNIFHGNLSLQRNLLQNYKFFGLKPASFKKKDYQRKNENLMKMQLNYYLIVPASTL